MSPRRIDLGMGEPPLYLLVDEPKPGHTFRGAPPWVKPDEPVGLVHVMSTPAGGEVRGYYALRGKLWLRFPVYPERWPELDAEVTRATGLDVIVQRTT